MVKEVDVEEMQRLVNDGAILIDVREEDEFEEGAIEGGENMPLSRFDDFKDVISQSDPIVFYCRSGKRSMQAAQIAEDWTDQPVYSLKGGYLAYIDEQ